jgi:hypothetical protein
MNRSIFILIVLVLALACTDTSEDVLPINEKKTSQILDSTLVDSANFLLFKGTWEVQRYTSNVCETTSADCHEVTLDKSEQPLYTHFEFLIEEVIAFTSTKTEAHFDIRYLEKNQLIFENDATRSNQWDGTQNIVWTSDEEIIMTNRFYSVDSTFIFTDEFDLKRQ